MTVKNLNQGLCVPSAGQDCRSDEFALAIFTTIADGGLKTLLVPKRQRGQNGQVATGHPPKIHLNKPDAFPRTVTPIAM